MKKTAILYTLAAFLPFLVMGQDQNHLKSTTYQQPYTQTQVEAGNIHEDHKIEAVTYVDGLGRPLQSVAQRAGNSKEDLVTPMDYDGLGRQGKQYLPYPVADNNGAYVASPFNPQEDFYLNAFPGDANGNNMNAYSETRFEASPLGRPLEQGAPGQAWKVDAGSDGDRTIKYGYDLNGNDVESFSVSFGTGTDDPQLIHHGKYTANLLYMTVTKDENWQPGDNNKHTTREYTNRQGQVVLKRTHTYNMAHDTYYVYDDFGNLTYVLSPEASAQIMDPSGNLTSNSYAVLDELGYQYRYDSRNRLIEKKVPGKGWEYIVYNTLDQPVFTQDTNQRNNGNRWLFTKYDAFGRVIMTGEQDRPDGETRSQLQTSVNTNYQANYESRSGTPVTVGGTTVYYTHDKAAPTSTAGDITLHTINYYDSYDHVMEGMTLPGAVYGTPVTNDVMGLPTVNRVRVLGGNDWIHTHTGYDSKGRAVYTKSVNPYLGSTDISRSLLDFTGKPLEVHSTHIKQGIATIQVMDYYTYDHMGRMLTHRQKIGSEEVQLIASNHYDALGQMIQKDVGGTTLLEGYTALNNIDVTPDGTLYSTDSSWNWPASAKTQGVIPSGYDGYIEMIVGANAPHTRFGFVKPGAGSANEYLDYGIYLGRDSNDDNLVLVVENGISTSANRTFQAGDLFRVSRTNGYLRLYHNNTEITVGAFPLALNSTENDKALTGKIAFSGPGAGGAEQLRLAGPLVDKRLQAVNYKYNVRGWLTDINDVESGAPNAGFKTVDTYSDLFNMRINYNTVEGDYLPANPEVVPLYNGNIAETVWRTANTDKNKRSYGYQYDALNRLKKGIMRHGEQLDILDTQTKTHKVWNIGYDRNGNIQQLKRDGYSVLEKYDDLVYTYKTVNGVTTNRLAAVADNANGSNASKARGFVDGTNTSDDYTYDTNGNMISDANKGITAITYNHLNLPQTVTVNNGATNGIISYVYDAVGTKLKKSVSIGGNLDVTEYANGYVYNNESGSLELQFVSHPEGYIMPTPSDTGGGNNEDTKSIKKFSEDTGQTTQTEYLYVFQYKDHLGNVRLSYADDDGNGSIDPDEEIIEESNYMPFGLQHWGYNNNVSSTANLLAQQWKFGGKQLQKELGLNWYDVSARNYDPALGRWMNIDPLAEKMRRHSPYNYAFDNPIRFLDPDGMAPQDIILGRNEVANRELNQDEINELMTGLQSITDDKLQYNAETGRVDIVERGSGKKGKGTELIRRLVGHDKNVTLNKNNVGKLGMVGAASGAENESEIVNESNGIGTNVAVDVGNGHDIYTQNFDGGEISEETLSTGDMLSHELPHALAQMNGESLSDSPMSIYYTDSDGNSQIERVGKEEVAVLNGRGPSKKMPEYTIPSENALRYEQGKTKRLNYHKSFQIKRK